MYVYIYICVCACVRDKHLYLYVYIIIQLYSYIMIIHTYIHIIYIYMWQWQLVFAAGHNSTKGATIQPLQAAVVNKAGAGDVQRHGTTTHVGKPSLLLLHDFSLTKTHHALPTLTQVETGREGTMRQLPVVRQGNAQHTWQWIFITPFGSFLGYVDAYSIWFLKLQII